MTHGRSSLPIDGTWAASKGSRTRHPVLRVHRDESVLNERDQVGPAAASVDNDPQCCSGTRLDFADDDVQVLLTAATPLRRSTRRSLSPFLRQPGTLGEQVGAGRDDAGPSVTTGSYLAPRFSQWGKLKVTRPRKNARDAAMARRLWDVSVELTGCDWPV
jgi:hypothetical protein